MKKTATPQPERQEMTELILSYSKFDSAQELIPLREALGRVNSRPLRAVNTLPNQPVSHMDGIAYRYADYQAAGGDCRAWQEGVDYCFSNTGVAVPQQFDTVTLIEDVDFSGGGLRILRAPAASGEHIAPVGSRMQSGQLLVAADTLLTPAHLGLLASGGVMQLLVYKRPRVAIIPSGDELLSAEAPLQPGKNVESNSIVLSAQITSWGGEPVVWPIIPDDPDFLSDVLRQAVDSCDIVILNAGSSKGRKDFAAEALNRVGEVYVYEVGHGPGKHTSFTLAQNGKPILGLVGPSGGAELTAEWYLQPLICKYLHKPVLPPPTVTVRLMQEVKAHVPFEFFMSLIIYRQPDGSYWAWPGGGPGRAPRLRGDGQLPNAVLRIPGGRVFAAGEYAEAELRLPEALLPQLSAQQRVYSPK